MSTQIDTTEARKEGMNAAQDDNMGAKSKNPYPRRTVLARAWDDGYAELSEGCCDGARYDS